MIKNKSIFIILIVFIFMILILLIPDPSIKGVSQGLLISSNVIVPSLFPFCVCVLIILKSNIVINNIVINKIIHKIFGHNFNMFFVFFISLIGGYPIGAKLINELYIQKNINNKTANIMLLYCVNAGPTFVISAIGLNIFNNKKIGILLLVSHITSSLILALLLSRRLKKLNIYTNAIKGNHICFSQNFTQSVSEACECIINICSYLIVFSVINQYLEYFSNNLSILKYMQFFIDLTSSIYKCNNLYAISFLLGFSGFSIWCQIFAMCKNIKLNYLCFIFGRFLHATLSVLILKVLLLLFKIDVTTYSNNITISKNILYSNFILFISVFIMLIVLLVYIYTKNNSRKIIQDMI